MRRRDLLAEAVGTFALVFAGTGAIVINDVTGGTVGHIGISLTFGFVVLAMIYALGDISGAHFNPAVTLGFWTARRIERSTVLPYILSQCAGALLASLLMRFLFPFHESLGTTQPAGSDFQSFALESVLTFLLMLVILQVSTDGKERGTTAGMAIGAVIALEALFAGPISGASMNPARSFAPALVSLQLAHLWIYILAPLTGAVGAVFVARGLQPS
jgi:aquaporin Z